MLLISALEIFLTWAVIAIALIGLGFVVLALFGRDHSLIDAFWMGLAISVAVLEIWNLLLPVTSSIALFLFGIGLFGLAVSRSKLRAGLLAAWKNLGFHLFTGFLLCALWATLLPACARCVSRVDASPADWFHCILAVPAFFWTTRSRIVGTQTDEPAAIVALVAAGILFADLCETHRQDQDR